MFNSLIFMSHFSLLELYSYHHIETVFIKDINNANIPVTFETFFSWKHLNIVSL